VFDVEKIDFAASVNLLCTRVGIDYANWILFADVAVQAFREQRALGSALALYESLHRHLLLMLKAWTAGGHFEFTFSHILGRLPPWTCGIVFGRGRCQVSPVKLLNLATNIASQITPVLKPRSLRNPGRFIRATEQPLVHILRLDGHDTAFALLMRRAVADQAGASVT